MKKPILVLSASLLSAVFAMAAADVEAENPVNSGMLNGLSLNPYFGNSKISYELSIKNTGSNDIRSISVRTEITNGIIYERTVNLSEPLKPGDTSAVSVINVPNTSQGIFDLTAVLIKVNGIPVDSTSSQTATYSSYDNGYPRYPVIEEYTGTWCSWSPRGIVTRNLLRNSYPGWIRMAVHVNDEMSAPSAFSLVNAFDPLASAQLAFTNRYMATSVLGNAEGYYDSIHEHYASYPAYVNLDFTPECNEDASAVTISAVAEFSIDTDVQHLMSFALVEDEVGPYSQANGFADGALGNMDGWESKGSSVSMTFNDVLRELSGYPGDEESLPQNIEMEVPYLHEVTLPLSKVKSDTFRIIGMVTNAKTGEIVNAREYVWYKDNGAGLRGVYAPVRPAVRAEAGSITVEGASQVSVFTADGRRTGTTGLAPGIYIVVADGFSTRVLLR
jgi:hypothetical protein